MQEKTTRTKLVIDPVTRLEGHGRIEVFLDDRGEVERAYLQIPELRGFEKFTQGRAAEEMPQITSRICGVCPMAHHMAATKALDSLYRVEPPIAAKLIRELVYSAFFVEDHALHLFFLGGPDLIMGADAAPAERNVLGVINKLGTDLGKRIIGLRRQVRECVARVAGKAIHPVFGLPGGVAKPLSEEDRAEFLVAAAEAVEFGKVALELFDKAVLQDERYLELMRSEAFTLRSSYMGMVDSAGQLNFYDGKLRVVSPEGDETALFAPSQYLDHITENAEPWSFVKFCFLKKPNTHQSLKQSDGTDIYAVGPLARLNACKGISTPLAAAAYRDFCTRLGGRPVHHTLATHWARLIEMVHAAERMQELAADERVREPKVRTLPTARPSEGIGVVEAPRGTLFHHYNTDERGVITRANLIVATQNNAARMAVGLEKVARALIHGADVPESTLNKLEMSLRAYDPCYGCASHSLPGHMPLEVRVHGAAADVIAVLTRDSDGTLRRA